MSLKTEIIALALNGGTRADAEALVNSRTNKAAGWTPEVIAHVHAHAADAQVAPKAKVAKVAKVKAAKFVPVPVANYLPLAYVVYVDGTPVSAGLHLNSATVGKQGATTHHATLVQTGRRDDLTLTQAQVTKLATDNAAHLTVFYGTPDAHSHKLTR